MSLFKKFLNFLFPPSIDLSFATPFDGFAKLISVVDGNTYDVGVSDVTEVTFRVDVNKGLFGLSSGAEQVRFDYTFSGDDGEMFSSEVVDSESPFLLGESSSPFYVKPGDHQMVTTALDADSKAITSTTTNWKFIDSSA